MSQFRLLIHSARQIVQVVSNGELFLSGERMKDLSILEVPKDHYEGFSIVIDRNGKIAAIGTDTEVQAKYPYGIFDSVIDAKAKCILPGFVDAHTHPVWIGDRVNEFSMKLSGASYMDIHKAGGGINFTVEKVREATEEQLYTALKKHLLCMLRSGTTFVECKSGYGLNAETEIKMLKVIERARQDIEIPLDISTTYCGAHSIPRGSTAEEATNDVINEQIPEIQKLRESGALTVDNIDVFCEKGVFNVEQTERILKCGKALGLAINFHGEELNRLHSAEMGGKLKAEAISHLEEVSDDGIKAMSCAGTTAVLLPTTAYILRLCPPPARKMIEGNVPVALGSDFNPNAYCMSMPMVMHLACLLMHMSMSEALTAATLNAARSLGCSSSQGSLEIGKKGDMIIMDAPRWEHIIYQFGNHSEIIDSVIKEGIVAYQKNA